SFIIHHSPRRKLLHGGCCDRAWRCSAAWRRGAVLSVAPRLWRADEPNHAGAGAVAGAAGVSPAGVDASRAVAAATRSCGFVAAARRRARRRHRRIARDRRPGAAPAGFRQPPLGPLTDESAVRIETRFRRGNTMYGARFADGYQPPAGTLGAGARIHAAAAGA